MIALCSTTNKAELVNLASGLISLGWEIWATEGTAEHLKQANLPVTVTTSVLGSPPIMGGRVKTLHWTVFGSLLWDKANPQHNSDAQSHGLPDIGMVVADLYPFEKVISRGDRSFARARECIDIGGAANIRAAAKNFEYVIPLVDQTDYQRVLDRLVGSRGAPDGVTLSERRSLAAKVFAMTARHDSLIARFLEDEAAVSSFPNPSQVMRLTAE
jgi:phosphoribosylaminoimidazolecarboxamide formyltransferase/IMP cyclohydrolase